MINRDCQSPLYRQLYQLLKDDIMNGVYGRGALLPAERALCRQHTLDRSTVRRGLQLLAQENLVERHQGQGTIVTYNPARRETGTILFLLCGNSPQRLRIDETFHKRSRDMLETALQKQNDRLVYTFVSPGDDALEIIRRSEAKAVVAAGRPWKRMCETLCSLPMPVVVFNAQVDGLACVLPDNEAGAAAACRTLLRYGHQKVGLIGVPSHDHARKRFKGFCCEWLQSGHAGNQILTENGDWTEQSGYRAATRLIRAKVTAIFAVNDAMAVGAIRAAKEAGLEVPRELSVIGYDDISRPAATEEIALSSVHTDMEGMVNATLMLIRYQRQTGSHNPVNVIVPVQLIHRESVAQAYTARCAGA